MIDQLAGDSACTEGRASDQTRCRPTDSSRSCARGAAIVRCSFMAQLSRTMRGVARARDCRCACRSGVCQRAGVPASGADHLLTVLHVCANPAPLSAGSHSRGPLAPVWRVRARSAPVQRRECASVWACRQAVQKRHRAAVLTSNPWPTPWKVVLSACSKGRYVRVHNNPRAIALGFLAEAKPIDERSTCLVEASH